MSSNNALMRQKLVRLQGKRTTIQIEAKGLARDIAPLINPILHEIEDMEIARAASKMDELVMKQADLINLQSSIEDLEEELG